MFTPWQIEERNKKKRDKLFNCAVISTRSPLGPSFKKGGDVGDENHRYSGSARMLSNLFDYHVRKSCY
jgi:hypothetical protein